MSAKTKWFPIFCIQYFADGASGGDGGDGAGTGTAAGDNAADAGRDSLEALGVPREYAERHRKRTEKKQAEGSHNLFMNFLSGRPRKYFL